MLFADYVYLGVFKTAMAVLYLSLFGLGIICTLAKAGRYRGMLVGTFGCLGMLLLAVATYLADMPVSVLAMVGEVGDYLIRGRGHATNLLLALEPWHGLEVARFIFLALIVMGLGGRLKLERTAVNDEIDRMMGEPV